MIPYFTPPSIPLGPVTLEPFGLLTAAGVLVGVLLAQRAARREGLNPQVVADFGFWGLLGGLLAGHLMHLGLYHPEEYTGPLSLLKVWEGLSSTGGMIGGVLAAALYFRLKGLSFRRYADALALGAVPGWAVARLGCFAVHDHPGRRTDFFLAVVFPDGPRHDLGLYEALMLGAMTALLYALRSRHRLQGRLLPLAALLYGVGRFGLDFLRATDLAYVDARYFGLTPAQYVCMLLVAYGVWGLTARPLPDAPLTDAGSRRVKKAV